MRIFVDTANLLDIREALKRGFRGVTTNPSLLAKEPRASFESHIIKIIELIREHCPGDSIHLSVEVFSQIKEEIIRQARHFRDTFNYPSLSIKIPIGWDELEIIRILNGEGISVNCTCCMSANQAVMAAGAGAKYISLFWGRISDVRNEKYAELLAKAQTKGALSPKDFHPAQVVEDTRKMLGRSYPDCKIIVGSIRQAVDVRDAGVAGADIVTVPPKFFSDMITHFKTDEVVEQFLSDFKAWFC